MCRCFFIVVFFSSTFLRLAMWCWFIFVCRLQKLLMPPLPLLLFIFQVKATLILSLSLTYRLYLFRMRAYLVFVTVSIHYKSYSEASLSSSPTLSSSSQAEQKQQPSNKIYTKKVLKPKHTQKDHTVKHTLLAMAMHWMCYAVLFCELLS